MQKQNKFIKSFVCGMKGIGITFQTQRNARIHAVCAAGVLWAAWYFQVSITELLVLIITIVIVIMAETINTALETVVNMFTADYHPLAKKAKDIAAGAVLLAAFGAVVEGIMIFGPKIIQLFN